jgi:hypothetical protein
VTQIKQIGIYIYPYYYFPIEPANKPLRARSKITKWSRQTYTTIQRLYNEQIYNDLHEALKRNKETTHEIHYLIWSFI